MIDDDNDDGNTETSHTVLAVQLSGFDTHDR